MVEIWRHLYSDYLMLSPSYEWSQKILLQAVKMQQYVYDVSSQENPLETQYQVLLLGTSYIGTSYLRFIKIPDSQMKASIEYKSFAQRV